MCGIIGYVKRDGDAVKSVYEGLKRLEYRGYDSAGIAALEGGAVKCVKRKGGVDNLKEGAALLSGSVAMGHTRWATHGEPSDTNAHPHTSGKITIVHNGIIENFAALASELKESGEKFVSDTDSEVIAKLIDANYAQSGDLLGAVAGAVKRLEGSFALGVMCADFNGLITVKYKSSQVIGFAKEGTFVASDIPALENSVSEIFLPADGVICAIEPDKTSAYDFDLQPVNCVRKGISLSGLSADKCGYAHFMLKEIGEAESTIVETVNSFFRCGCINRLKSALAFADRVIILGCGTAYNAGLVAKPYFERNGGFCSVEIASEVRYFPPRVTKKTVVIAVSQSGETADTVEAVSLLKSRGAFVVAITNCGYSAITRVAHAVVPVCAHSEICVAATKSYIGQIAALYLLASVCGDSQRAGRELEDAAALIPEILQQEERAKSIAGACAGSSAVFFLGRGGDYAAAVEASLKLKEVSYVFSDAYPAGELKHGTLALIDENTVSVFIICEQTVEEKCVNALEQVLSRKGKAVVLTCLGGVEERLNGKAEVWRIPQTSSALAPLLCGVALQSVAYYTAVALGKNPDKPRNLAKSVTVE